MLFRALPLVDLGVAPFFLVADIIFSFRISKNGRLRNRQYEKYTLDYNQENVSGSVVTGGGPFTIRL